jgi:hypothetical protein
MSRTLVIKCPKCGSKMTQFAVQHDLISERSVFTFSSMCDKCEVPIHTLIENSEFEDQARRKSVEQSISQYDKDEFKKLNIKW